jgi:hypothetical protein
MIMEYEKGAILQHQLRQSVTESIQTFMHLMIRLG